MRESKLTEMLKGITPFEFKRFGEFLNSPFHNKSKKILQLYELINGHYEEFDANVITNEKIAREIFYDEKKKDQNARTLISNFSSLLEEFIIYNKSTKNPVQQKVNLLEALRERNIIKNFEMVSKEITDINKKEFNKNTEYYFYDLTHKEILFSYHGEDLDLDLDKSYSEMSESADFSSL
jgi:hypothetical protein